MTYGCSLKIYILLSINGIGSTLLFDDTIHFSLLYDFFLFSRFINFCEWGIGSNCGFSIFLSALSGFSPLILKLCWWEHTHLASTSVSSRGTNLLLRNEHFWVVPVQIFSLKHIYLILGEDEWHWYDCLLCSRFGVQTLALKKYHSNVLLYLILVYVCV